MDKDQLLNALTQNRINCREEGLDIRIWFTYTGEIYSGLITDFSGEFNLQVDVHTNLAIDASAEEDVEKLLRALNARKRKVTLRINQFKKLDIHICVHHTPKSSVFQNLKRTIVKATNTFLMDEPYLQQLIDGKSSLTETATIFGVAENI